MESISTATVLRNYDHSSPFSVSRSHRPEIPLLSCLYRVAQAFRSEFSSTSWNVNHVILFLYSYLWSQMWQSFFFPCDHSARMYNGFFIVQRAPVVLSHLLEHRRAIISRSMRLHDDIRILQWSTLCAREIKSWEKNRSVVFISPRIMFEFGLASIFGLIDYGTNFFSILRFVLVSLSEPAMYIYHVTTSFLLGNPNKAIRNFPTVTYEIQGSTSAISQWSMHCNLGIHYLKKRQYKTTSRCSKRS